MEENHDHYIKELTGEAHVQNMIEYVQDNVDQVVETIITVCEVPAPTFCERERARLVRGLMSELGGIDAQIDRHNNVVGRYPGECSTARLAVTAHIDTVFPKDVDVSVQQKNDHLAAPGIGDNSTSVAGMLHLIAAWNKTGYKPPFDVLFVGNACEEGLGDLRGIKGFLHDCEECGDVQLQAVCIFDGRMGGVINRGVGSRRLKVTLRGKGGHSWKDFGTCSAIHNLGRCIDSISRLDVPQRPRTSYNVGVVEGGTSVNTIAESASMLIDMRSEAPKQLHRLEERVRRIIKQQTAQSDCTAEVKVVGDRPVGGISDEHPLVSIAQAAGRYLGLPMNTHAASTDANVPLSRGIPAVTVGIYRGEGAHRTDESITPSSLTRGLPLAVLLVMGAVKWLARQHSLSH